MNKIDRCLCEFVQVFLPWAAAGALSVHDASSAGSGAVGPLRPRGPLAVHRPGTMLSVFNTLTPSTPLGNEEMKKRKEKNETTIQSVI